MKYSMYLCMAVALALSACGGGGTQIAGGAGEGGTGVAQPSITVGAISGFGSVIVNGVRYDNSAVNAQIEDGDDDGGGLKLGNVVRVEGEINDDKISGKAKKIEMGAEIKGPVDSKISTTSFIAMGATIVTNAATIYDNVAADLSNLNAGDIVQVHGLPDNNGVITAARVQKRTQTTLPVYKTAGVVVASPAPTNAQIKVGALTVNINASTSIRDLASPIPAGTIVRIKTSTTPVNGAITATQIRPFVAGPQADNIEAEIRGFITEFSASGFKVAGLPVAVSASTTYERGAAADLANGKLVEVEGRVTGGVIQARKIKFEDSSGSGTEYEFEGTITNFVSSADFKVQGQAIDASGSVQFEGGIAADLANGKRVDVKGTTITAGKLIATRVRFR